MASWKVRIEQGRGGKLGRSRMDDGDLADWGKEAARHARRLNDRKVIADDLYRHCEGDDAPPEGQRIRSRVPRRMRTPEQMRRSALVCPVCLLKLYRISRRNPKARVCYHCGARHTSLPCRRCGCRNVWVAKRKAACRDCGLFGDREQVVARRTR